MGRGICITVLIETVLCRFGKSYEVLNGGLKEVVGCGADITTVGAYFFKKLTHFGPDIFSCAVGKNAELVHPAD